MAIVGEAVEPIVPKPAFDSDKVVVIFVLGGPGAGEAFTMRTFFCRLIHGNQGKGHSVQNSSKTLGFVTFLVSSRITATDGPTSDAERRRRHRQLETCSALNSTGKAQSTVN